VIESVRHKGLKEFLEKGRSGKVAPDLIKRLRPRLAALDGAKSMAELNQPGFDFHPLSGTKPPRHSIHVNGNWCLTFERKNGKMMRLDLEDYH
jgi:proteic killer suppression protein